MRRIGDRKPAALIATLLWLAACPRSARDAGPAPVSMTPSEGTGVAALAVTIVGDHFDASTDTDFGKGSGTLAATFQASLVPDGGGTSVALDSVTFTSERKLQANVPAGIARGTYTLEVTDPAGRKGTLAQAFRVYAGPENVVAFRVEPQETAHAGVPFLVQLTAVDAGGAVVEGFTDPVTLSDLTGTIAPTGSGPFVQGRRAIRLTVSTLSAADRITGVDALGRTGSSAPFAVVAGPPVALAFESAPSTVVAGSCSSPVTVGLRDSKGNPAPASATVDVDLQSSPAGSVSFHSGGGCASPVTAIAISPGAISATFRFTGPAPGAVVLRASPAGLPSTTYGVTLSP